MFQFRVIYANGEITVIKGDSLKEIGDKQYGFVKKAKKDKSIVEVGGVKLNG